jgi:hypothetical protein
VSTDSRTRVYRRCSSGRLLLPFRPACSDNGDRASALPGKDLLRVDKSRKSREVFSCLSTDNPRATSTLTNSSGWLSYFRMSILWLGRTLTNCHPSPRYVSSARYLRRGQCILFVGSGVSIPSGLPPWSNIVGALRSRLGPKVNLEGFDSLERTRSTASFPH